MQISKRSRLGWTIVGVLFLAMLPAIHGDEPKPAGVAKKPAVTKMFDGKSLDGWRIIDKFDFVDHGKVEVKDGEIVLEAGKPATGIAWTGKMPKIDYEVTLETCRLEGSDFFCGITFPIRDSHASLILGGWGGGVTGLSNVDGNSAVENETTGYIDFKKDRWYKVRLRVAADKIAAWVDDEQIVDLKTADRTFAVWWEQEPARPFGIVTWNTKGGLRNIQIKTL